MMEGTSDGTLMVFLSSRTKRNEAWIRDLRTGHERQLTFSGAETEINPADEATTLTELKNKLLGQPRYYVEVRGVVYRTNKPEDQELAKQRAEARAKKDFATADAIRDRIKAAGIEVEDTPDGPKWSLS